MRSVEVSPKASPVAVARLGAGRTFNVNVPSDDAELASKCDGKLTLLSLAQDFLAERHQRAVLNFLNKSATATGEGRAREFAPDQIVSDDELATIITDQESEVYRLLIGERAAGGGRESAKAAAQRMLDEQAASQITMLRTMFAAQTSKAGRQLISQMALGFGYGELAAEFDAS